MTKEQIREEMLRAQIEGYKPSQQIDLSNFILDSDNLTTGLKYPATATGDYSLQKWINKAGEKMCGIKSEMQIIDDNEQTITKRIFGDYEAGKTVNLIINEATDNEGKPILSKRSGKPYRNFQIAETVLSKVAEKISVN